MLHVVKEQYGARRCNRTISGSNGDVLQTSERSWQLSEEHRIDCPSIREGVSFDGDLLIICLGAKDLRARVSQYRHSAKLNGSVNDERQEILAEIVQLSAPVAAVVMEERRQAK